MFEPSHRYDDELACLLTVQSTRKLEVSPAASLPFAMAAILLIISVLSIFALYSERARSSVLTVKRSDKVQHTMRAAIMSNFPAYATSSPTEPVGMGLSKDEAMGIDASAIRLRLKLAMSNSEM